MGKSFELCNEEETNAVHVRSFHQFYMKNEELKFPGHRLGGGRMDTSTGCSHLQRYKEKEGVEAYRFQFLTLWPLCVK